MNYKFLFPIFIILLLSNIASATYINTTYTSNGTWTAPAGVTSISIMLVGGGGSGGSTAIADGGDPGGGGAGGFVQNLSYTVVPGTIYNITVGIGGWRTTGSVNGNNGTNSSFGNDTLGTISAMGGGGGGHYNILAYSGGSGGGGGSKAGASGYGIGYQGRNGGAGSTDSATYDNGGGGGGAGGVGQDASAAKGGNGGTGNTSLVNGSMMFSCGGGGAGYTGKSAGSAGCSSAGAGGISGAAGSDAVNGTGSGGGAGKNGGFGGNGIVNISYLQPTITSWTNNYTNNATLDFTKITGSNPVNFSITTSGIPSYFEWQVDSVAQNNNLPYFNRAFPINGTFNITAIANFSTYNVSVTWNVSSHNYTLELLNPVNGSTGISTPVTLLWRQWPNSGAAHTYYIATDDQFINIVISGSITPTNESYTTSLSLLYSTKYYWKVYNGSSYSNISNFTTSAPTILPGQFNITVVDEQNTSLRIMNFTTQLSNTTHTLAPKITSTGWTNYSGAEVIAGQYLIIVTPNTPYYQRMVLATSPANITMYVPNSTSPNIIDLISFSLLDVTGFFPYTTSTITILRGGLVMDKAYFSADGTHPVYLLQGNNYQIQIQNGNNLQSFANFVPLTSATSQIVINDFSPNMTQLNPFTYNMTYNTSEIVLRWSDIDNVLTSLNFTVKQGSNYSVMTQICQLTTSVSHGQSICSITNNSIYRVNFTAILNDGTFQNASFIIDYTKGKRQDSTGVSAIDGSPIGIGFKWNYGSFTMPDWVYTWIVLLVLILLAGTFGTYHAGIGGIITLIMALIFEVTGLFRPLGSSDPDNLVTMGITGAMLVMVILYYLQHRDKGG